VLIAVLLVVVVLVVLGVVLLLNSGSTPTPKPSAAGGTTTSKTVPTTTPATTTPAATTPAVPVGHATSTGTIPYQSAGQLVVNYFDNISDMSGRFALLTPGAQAAIGGLSGFEQYWGKFSDVSSAHAIGVTTNPDGSVEVPIQVTYTSTAGATNTVHKTLRVVQENGHLLIDDNPM
jgi:hypothetical protein